MSDARAVLVTGANSGLGLATVIAVAKQGFRSVGTVRSESKAAIVAAAAEVAGVEVDTVLLELTDAEQCGAVIEEIQPWGLVNNAGVLDQRLVEEVSDEDARWLLETLTIAPMRMARLALPYMRKQGGGRIVQVSSISGRVTFPRLGWYQAAKHALEAASDALRMEVARDDIDVSIIEPGVFESSLTEEAVAIPWFRAMWSSPEFVAKSVITALTARAPRARYVVGADAKLNAVTAPFSPTLVRDAVLRVVYGL